MKTLSSIINVLLYIIVTIVLTASIGSAIRGKPMLMSSVRSNSMYPLFQRSDMILIKNISKEDMVNIGDIVVFKVEKGSLSSKGWIVHRIIGGNEIDGYITQGDANEYSDQASGGTGPIQKHWIVSKVITFGSSALKIPLIGYLPLWMEKYQTNPYILPSIAVVLAAIIGVTEIQGSKHKPKNKNKLNLLLIYFLGGVTISIIVAATMLATSTQINVPYEISNNNIGVMMGSNVGIIKIGDVLERPLSELNNKGFFPIITTITSNDSQIQPSHTMVKLSPGDYVETTMKVVASNAGLYQATISIGMFYPFLPSKIIYTLASKSYWLALGFVSLVPGIPFMLYPLLDTSLRKKTIKEIRRLNRRIRKFIPIFN